MKLLDSLIEIWGNIYKFHYSRDLNALEMTEYILEISMENLKNSTFKLLI